jgi:hypothetical protein
VNFQVSRSRSTEIRTSSPKIRAVFYNTQQMVRIVILALVAASQVFGCVCAGFLTPKEEWRRSSLVFVGRVERASPEFEEKNPYRPQRAFVRVEEAFKGAQKYQLIEIDQTGSDCELKYSRGWRKLLYLDSKKGALWLSPGCDRSRDAESASDDLRFLHALPGSADRTRISGEVMLSGDRSHPMSDVTITLTPSLSGRSPTTAMTDGKGVFEVYDLPEGSYTVSVSVPAGLKPDFGFVSGRRKFSNQFPLTVNLGDSDATAVFYFKSANAK